MNTKKSSTVGLTQQETSRRTEPNSPFTLLVSLNRYAIACKKDAYNFMYSINAAKTIYINTLFASILLRNN